MAAWQRNERGRRWGPPASQRRALQPLVEKEEDTRGFAVNDTAGSDADQGRATRDPEDSGNTAPRGATVSTSACGNGTTADG